MLTGEEVMQFKKLVLEVYGIELTDQQAADQGLRLVKLFELMLKHKISPLDIEKTGWKVQYNG